MTTTTDETMAATVAALERMTVGELKDRWRELMGEEPRSNNRQWLWKRLAWHVQAKAYGGLSDRARQRARELVDETQIRVRPTREFKARIDQQATSAVKDRRLPAPGAVVTRQYKGRRVEVTVLPRGFEYDGVTYRSLSAVARAVTGSHWNGYLFFELGGNGNGKRHRA